MPRELPHSALAVYTGDRWIQWWRSDSAPTEWTAADPRLTQAIEWQPLQPGLDLGRLRLAGSGEAWRVGVVLVRADPAIINFELTTKPRAGGGAALWNISDAPAQAAVAFNAGQFRDAVPWGWIVRRRQERKAPGTGPLAPAVIIPYEGPIEILPADSIEARRSDRRIRDAFQSYPVLIERDGVIPAALRDTGTGLDVGHRDSRLVFGLLRDGHVLIALTRFEALGGALSLLPFGLTAPETAALMGALGARRAVMLDGGISGQLLVRDSVGRTTAWQGLRRVPLGLIGIPHPHP